MSKPRRSRFKSATAQPKAWDGWESEDKNDVVSRRVLLWRAMKSNWLLIAVVVLVNILLLPFYLLLIQWPWFAILPAILFGVFYAASNKRNALLAAGLWFLYLPYEYSMKFRLLCTGECNIRVDLLLIYPVLFGFTVAGCLAFASALRAKI